MNRPRRRAGGEVREHSAKPRRPRRAALPILLKPLAILLATAAAGCERPSGPASVTRSRPVMGTLAKVTAVAADGATARAAVEAGYARLVDVDHLMSDYVANSEIGQLNQLPQGGSLTVSPETFHCLERALEVSVQSGGAFDPTCRPLIELWKQAAKDGRLPSEERLSATRARIGRQKLKLVAESRTVTLLGDDVRIDLGGIAKGYALDLAVEAMKNAGATGGLVDIGGDVSTFGRRETGEKWLIGVRDPFQPSPTRTMLKLRLTDRALATSGVQERFYEIDGKRYSHIVDPRTGWPAEEAPSVTVIAPDGITADAWATALSILSPAKGQALLDDQLKDSGIEVLWISGTAKEPRIQKTAGFDRYLLE